MLTKILLEIWRVQRKEILSELLQLRYESWKHLNLLLSQHFFLRHAILLYLVTFFGAEFSMPNRFWVTTYIHFGSMVKNPLYFFPSSLWKFKRWCWSIKCLPLKKFFWSSWTVSLYTIHFGLPTEINKWINLLQHSYYILLDCCERLRFRDVNDF